MSASVTYLETADDRERLAAFYRRALLDDTLAFWFPRAIDKEHGGYLHCFDRAGTLVDSDKSVWAQGRMSWLLLALYNTLAPHDQWLAWGLHGLEFLERHGFDNSGRMYFHLTREGQPIRQRRYAYSESFAAIASAAAFRATSQERYRAQALDLFDRFTHWNFTPGVMPPKFTGERPLIGLGPRMITIVTAQELRENLGETPQLTSWINRCIDEIERLFVKHNLRVVMESVALDGQIVDHFDGRLLNPGHGIEGAWFVMREGQRRRDSSLIKLGATMLDYMWERGWDDEHGGLFYYRDVFHKPVSEYWHDMKFWWPHVEAIIATLLAALLTGDDKYARWHRQVHDWSHAHFADPEFGEWYGYLHRDGRISTSLKGNLWKSCFHHPRMQWMCWRLLEEFANSQSLAAANGG